MKLRLFGVIAGLLLAIGILVPLSAPAEAQYVWHIPGTHPIIFVHGGAGSAAQFESQAMRFETNFYSHEYIYALEYDSSFTINTPAEVYAKLDTLIASIQDETGAEQVDVLGHSLGTTIMIGGTITLPGTPPIPTVTPGYLNSSAERAAKVAHYVNIDGRTATALPGSVVGNPVPTLALWAGRGVPGRQIVGATNVTIPDVTHVQSATSAESFVEMYKFFTGFPPVTKYILPELFGRVELAGRAVLFPLNIGAPRASVEIWEVNRDTGARIGKKPAAVYHVDADGNWGPFQAKMGQAYEFNIVRKGQSDHPSYYEPFIRSDYLIRLLTSGPEGGPSAYMDRSPNHVNLLLGRNMEFWGNDLLGENDVLEVNGTNVISPATNPIAKLVNYMFVYDKGADGVSHLGVPILYYHALPFFTGVDLFTPGAYPPNGTVSVALTSRTGGGKTQTINVPNLASSQIRTITVMFNDFVQPWP